MAAGTGEVRLGLLEQTEPDFPGAGEKPGVQIWRIEQLEPVALPTDEYGKFRTGDSYICLKTTGKKRKPWTMTYAYRKQLQAQSCFLCSTLR